MDDSGILGGALNQLGQTVKQAAKQVAKVPQELAKDLGDQVKGEKPKEKSAGNQPQKQWQSDEERKKFLRDLYGSSPLRQGSAGQADNQKSVSSNNKKPTEFEKQIADKSPEEQKKLLELRRDLHKEVYYDPTFNPPKNPPAGGEERPAEKVEKEKKIEMQELQKKEDKKPPPLAVQREQNKAEMFRGVSG